MVSVCGHRTGLTIVLCISFFGSRTVPYDYLPRYQKKIFLAGPRTWFLFIYLFFVCVPLLKLVLLFQTGDILNFDPERKKAKIVLTNGYLMKNDDIIIMGKKTDTYIHQKAELVEYKGKSVDKTPRGTSDKSIEIELKIDEPVIGEGQDKLYIFTDKTYKKQSYSL